MVGAVLHGDGFSIRIELREAYLRAHVFDGVDSLQVSIAMWKMLAEQCRLHEARQLLVIEDLQGTVDLDDMDAVVDAMQGFGLVDVRIAFVELREDIQGSEHGEVLAVERDLTVRVFSDEVLATHWLLYGSE